jgi:hypothetical protein
MNPPEINSRNTDLLRLDSLSPLPGVPELIARRSVVYPVEERDHPDLAKLLASIISHGAGDLHIAAGSPVKMSLHQKLRTLSTGGDNEAAPISPTRVTEIVKGLAPAANQRELNGPRGATDSEMHTRRWSRSSIRVYGL